MSAAVVALAGRAPHHVFGSEEADTRPGERMRGNREVTFWVLLLGSWMLLNSPAWPNQLLGGAGSLGFVYFAAANLGRLRGSGMDYARWEGAAAKFWWWAAASGLVCAIGAVWFAHLIHERIPAPGNWRILVLQSVLGPALEEILFRGYLIHLFLWGLSPFRALAWPAAILLSGMTFAALHLTRPGSGWKEFVFIAATGTLYGCLRKASRSTATAAVGHAVYNLALQIAAAVSV